MIRCLRVTSLLLLGFWISGCATTPQAQFYTLNDGSVAVGGSPLAVSLSLGPIDLPQYLDRPQIVSRGGDNRLNVDEFNRWGGSLDQEIQRVLAAQLGARLGTDRIYSYPSRIVASTDYRIALEIYTFDGPLGGELRLDVAWSVIDDRTADVIEVGRNDYRSASPRADYEAYASTLSGLLSRLAADLAVAVRAENKNPPRSDG